jgi:hypothetical protein
MEGNLSRGARWMRAAAIFVTAVAVPSAVASRASGATQLITFDEIRAGAGEGLVIPGNHYANQGVLMTSGKTSPDFFAVGDDLSFTDSRDQFAIAQNVPGATSLFNCFFPSPW